MGLSSPLRSAKKWTQLTSNRLVEVDVVEFVDDFLAVFGFQSGQELKVGSKVPSSTDWGTRNNGWQPEIPYWDIALKHSTTLRRDNHCYFKEVATEFESFNWLKPVNTADDLSPCQELISDTIRRHDSCTGNSVTSECLREQQSQQPDNQPDDLPSGKCNKCKRARELGIRRGKCCTCSELYHRGCTGQWSY
jgi:hypothetical protein